MARTAAARTFLVSRPAVRALYTRPWLKQGSNTITFFDLTGDSSDRIKPLRNQSSARPHRHATEAGDIYAKSSVSFRRNVELLIPFSVASAQTTATSPLQSPPPFRPGELWPDTSGTPITRTAGAFCSTRDILLFGEFKTAGPGGNSANVGVSVYTSQDLYHWKNQGVAFKVSDDPASDVTKDVCWNGPRCSTTPRRALRNVVSS